MKKNFLLTVFVFALFSACTSDETTTYYLIRHAEKDRTNNTNRNPSLNTNGLLRAKRWAKHFEKIKLDAVYSTDYKSQADISVFVTDYESQSDLKVFKVDYSPYKDYSEEDIEYIEGLIELDNITYKLSIKSLGLINCSLTKV